MKLRGYFLLAVSCLLCANPQDQDEKKEIAQILANLPTLIKEQESKDRATLKRSYSIVSQEDEHETSTQLLSLVQQLVEQDFPKPRAHSFDEVISYLQQYKQCKNDIVQSLSLPLRKKQKIKKSLYY